MRRSSAKKEQPKNPPSLRELVDILLCKGTGTNDPTEAKRIVLEWKRIAEQEKARLTRTKPRQTRTRRKKADPFSDFWAELRKVL